MSRTVKRESLLLLRELLDLRWEFLRRNEEYRADHSIYRELIAKHSSEEVQPVRQESFRLMAKYRLGALPDPSETPDGIRLPIMYPYGDQPEVSGFPGLRVFDPDGETNHSGFGGDDKFRVTIEVDLRTPRANLLPVLDLVLDELVQRRIAHHPYFHTEQDEEPSKDFGIYQWYLKIWDRHQAGESSEDIARALYPHVFEKPSRHFQPENAVDQIETGLREASRLIEESATGDGSNLPARDLSHYS